MPSDPDDTTTFDDVRCTRENPKAILVDMGGTSRNRFRWVPKSVVHDDSEVYKLNTTGKLVLLTWFAEKECFE